MPTVRPRHTITETDEIARALDRAARVWPELRDDRGALLRRILERGTAELDREADAWLARRRAAIRETAGSLTGVYRPNEAQLLRDEWPD
ncbi:MAG: hypothetical protein WBL06_01360 [Pseudolysinimonas sp.]|jgi:hypothetical protein|uniref:hypothetical protein n=1 Tax=Pseudolysinimonas sp. TaxID=2680009 RepID=UPI003C7304B1